MDNWKEIVNAEDDQLIHELRQISGNMPCMFPEKDMLTEQYVREQRCYQYLFGAWFLEKTQLERLDRQLRKKKYCEIPEEEKNFFQKNDVLGLNYFYLFAFARIERLSREEREILSEYMDITEDGVLTEKARSVVENTFQYVMAVEPEKPGEWFEPIQTIHGEYRLRGDQIALGTGSGASYREKGWFIEEKKEQERLQDFFRIQKKMVDVLDEKTGGKFVIWTDVFH